MSRPRSTSSRPLKLIRLKSLAQYRVLFSEVRFEIVEYLRHRDIASIAEIAEQLDRPADGLYAHIRKLQSIGVVEEAGSRPAGRRIEKLYRLTGDDIDYTHLQSPQDDVIIGQMAKLFLNINRRTIRDCVASNRMQLQEPGRNISLRCDAVWLTRERFDQMRDLLREMIDIVESSRNDRSGELYLFTALLFPIVRRRHARRR